jgi:hypothetical protein
LTYHYHQARGGLLRLQDYSALITISKLDELTDSLINERLGLDYYQQRSLPVKTASSSRPAADDREPPPPVQKEVLPAAPPAMVHGETLLPPTAATSIPPPQPTPTPTAPTPRHVSPPRPAVPTNRQISNTTPITSLQHPQESNSFLHNRQASGTGPEPLPELPADRQRKTSLTARLGKAFGNPAMQSRPSEYSSDGSPTSASGSSRIKSSFSKAFRRTSGGTSPQHSPRAETHDAPPVPPKDGHPVRPPTQSNESSGSGAYRTPSGGMGYAPPIVYVAPKEAGSSTAPGSFPEAVSGLYPARNSTENHLSPSPSAKRIMMEARIKSVEQEEEIQNRFRRGLNLDDKGPGAREEVDDLDDDIRLPYDTSDHSVTDHLQADGADDEPANQNAAPPNMQIPRKPVDYGMNDADDLNASGVDGDPVPSSNSQNSNGAAPPHEVLGTGLISEKGRAATAMVPLGPVLPSLDENLSDRLRDEQRQHENEANQVDHQEAESAERHRQAEELARQVDIQRQKEQEEQKRLEAEAQQRAEAAAELQRHAEEYALQQEAERLREQEERQRQQEEQERREAEVRRVQEELERQKKEEEEEKLRIALAEQHRMDQIRLAEEEARRRAEEESRIAAEKEEAERMRKEGIKQALRDGKQRGGVMLRGVGPCIHLLTMADKIQHVTVQTMKNPTWRRRVFRLLPNEMQLFKNETVSQGAADAECSLLMTRTKSQFKQ